MCLLPTPSALSDVKRNSAIDPGISILYTIGGLLVVIGIVLWLLGAVAAAPSAVGKSGSSRDGPG